VGHNIKREGKYMKEGDEDEQKNRKINQEEESQKM
jgi:hypothetical protein